MASEVMKVKLNAAVSNSEVDLLTVASGHTYTILNISIWLVVEGLIISVFNSVAMFFS